jgi:hypothetical protein
MRGDPLQSDVLNLYRTYNPPPKGFDPRTASDKLLRRHGVPRRPDPEREPKLSRLWRRAFARQPTFIKAELAINPVMSGRNPLRARGPAFDFTNWAGVVVESAKLGLGANEPAAMVCAYWVMPEIVPYAPFAGVFPVGFWVGLDGFNNEQVLQAGIAAIVAPSGPIDINTGLVSSWSVNWFAWTEWFTQEFQDPAVEVSNFPVGPGNTVFFVVCAPEPDSGYVSMVNFSTGHATNINIKARPGISSEGASAEWIVEATIPVLPNFNPVTFSGCIAGTEHDLFDLAPDGFVTNITDQRGVALTQTHIASPSTAVIEWDAWE